MYREIGDTFRITEFQPGLPEKITILEVVENNSMVCEDCYLRRMCMNQPRFKETAGYCSKDFREDGKNVVFKKVKTI
jgi:hypothetical protein